MVLRRNSPTSACRGASEHYEQAPPSTPSIGPFNTTASPFSATAGQIKTAKPGDPVERQLSGEQKFQAWSLDANVADDRNRWYRISAENVESLPEHMMLRRHVTTGAGPKGHPTA